MGKGSGNTRRSNAGGGANANGYASTDQWQDAVDKIAKGGNVDYDAWQNLTDKQRDVILMEAGFTGLVGDDIANGTLYYSQTKDRFIENLAQDLSQIAAGYNIDDTVSWTIGYADGTRKYLNNSGEDDISSKFGVTDMQSWTTQKQKVASALADSKIAYILRSDGYDQPRYYVSKKNNGMEQLKRYGSFEEWKNGRGEKKRDYIQDDWI